MTIEILKSKIHQATVTQANLYYVGSITIDEDLMQAANLLEHEKVSVVNVNNGERLDTYIIKGKRGSGVIGINGPAARKCCVGDVVVIMAYAQMSPDEARDFKPNVIFPDKLTNKLLPQ
jgi:aspartate 1-decarboxylase